MLKKNDEIIEIVTSLGANGEGIIKKDEYVVFVPFCLVGEKVKVRILRVTKNVAFGKVLEVFTPAEERVRPICPVFGKCGGCQIQHMDYKSQIDFKKNLVALSLKKIARIDVKVNSTVKSPNELRYRNKLQLPIIDENGETKIGFYAVNSHRVVEISDCPINPVWTKSIIEAISIYIKNNSLKGYNEENLSGDIREVTVKEVEGNLIITVVALHSSLPNKNELIEIFKSKIKCEFSLYINVNREDTNVIYGDNFYLLYGKPEYKGDSLGIKHVVGVRSFTQVNNEVCKKLYLKVKESVNADENTTVIDAYSGAGLMTALLSKDAKKAIGIEIVKEAVDCANTLSKDNGLSDKIENYCGKCEEILPEIIKKENADNTVIVLDPPRKGCDIKVIEAIIDSCVNKIVYVSCKPSTLARDLGLLVGTLNYDGKEIKPSATPVVRYEVESVTPFDMFPQTKHVETLCVLKRIK